MGVTGLWKLVEGASETWSLRTLAVREGYEGSRPERLYFVGIDASIWIHTMLHTFGTKHAQSGENPQFRHLFSRLAMLAERPIHAVFVADGTQRPAYKRGTEVKPAHVWLTDGLRRMVEAFGFVWIEAAGEAEAELARLSSLGLIDAVMTDDSDTLVFGATVIIRNPSFKRAGSDKVIVYRKNKILESTGLSTDDQFLFALLVGCDYDQAGLCNCGPKVAEGLARYGFGRTLRRAIDRYNVVELATYLNGWRDDLRSRLRDDPRGFIGQKHPRLAANIPSTFPNVEAARLLASPILLADAPCDTVLQPRPINFGELGAACERHFGWGSAAEICKTFRTTLWTCELTRMLVSEGLRREGTTSKIGRKHALLSMSLDTVGKKSAAGYVMCTVEVTDTGLGDAAKSALYGSRPYSSTAEVPEQEASRQSKEPLSTRVPAVILERARPWLITPSYKIDGFKYGYRGCDLHGGMAAASSLLPSKSRPSKKQRTSRSTSRPSQKTGADSAGASSRLSHARTSPSQPISRPSSSRTVALSSSLPAPSQSSSATGSTSSRAAKFSMACRTSGSLLSAHHGAAASSPLASLYSYFSLSPPSSPPSMSPSPLHGLASPSLRTGASASSPQPAAVSRSLSEVDVSPSSSSVGASSSSLQGATSSRLSSSAGASTSSSRLGASSSSPQGATSSQLSSSAGASTSSSRLGASVSSLQGATSSQSSSSGGSYMPSSSLRATSSRLLGTSHSSQAVLEIPEVLDDILDLTTPSPPPPRPRRARKLHIIDLTEDVIDLTVD